MGKLKGTNSTDPRIFMSLSFETSPSHGPLTCTRYVKLRVAHAPGMPETFYAPRRVSDPDMHHSTCPWCMPGSLTSFLWIRWLRKHSRHSWRMRNSQFYVSGKRPMYKRITFYYADKQSSLCYVKNKIAIWGWQTPQLPRTERPSIRIIRRGEKL